ncbi:MAG: hypothetical protein MHPSP_003442, partial [Paramarteilia canceri]
ALGFMKYIEEHERVMKDAYNMTSTGHCHSLCSMLLICCTPNESRTLFENHKIKLAFDIIERQR